MGEGSYGKVYSVIEKATKRKLAIKILDKLHIVKVIFQLTLI